MHEYFNNNLTIDANYEFANALHRAAYNNDLLLVEKLLSQKIDVNSKNESDDRTALHYAAMSNVDESHFKVVEILLKNDADVSAQDDFDRTPLWYLVTNGNVKIVQLFLNFNANFHEVDFDGDSLLSQVARFNKNIDVVSLLTSLGLDIKHRSKFEEKTPLHWACFSKFEDINIIKCLLKNGADINSIDNANLTPLLRGLQAALINREIDVDAVKITLGFMIEHSDFYLSCKLSSFLIWLNDYNELEYDVSPLWKIFLEYLAKLDTLNSPMHPEILRNISEHDEFNYYFKQCQEELLKAKNVKFTNSWITFFNLLIDSRKKLKNYAGNEDLIDDFKKSDCVNKFPIYGFLMDKNMKKGIKRRELFDKSTILLSDCLPIFSASHLIITDILNCIMSKKDLSKFTEYN